MKIISAEIEAFLAITKAKINLADRGLVLIQGVNHDDSSADSNGSGKSSLADALCWCLYGVTARGETGDDIVNDKIGKGTKVELVVEDGLERYWISRHRKHKTGKNSLRVTTVDGAGSEVDLTKGTDKLTQDVVLRIVGASYDVFKSAVYAGQEQMPDLPAMTDKHLKLLIEEASGVTLLEEAYKEARLRAGTAREQLDRASAELEKINDRLVWLEDNEQGALTNQADWITTQKAKIDAAKINLGTMVAAVKALNAELAKFDDATVVAQIEALDKKIAAVADEQAKLRDLDRQVTEAGGVVSAYTRAILTGESKVDAAKKALANVQHKVGCPCDECGRPLTNAELAAATDAAKKHYDEQVAAVLQATLERNSAQLARNSAQETRDKFAAQMTDVSAATSQRAALADLRASYKRSVIERDNQAARARELGEQIKKMAAETNPFDSQVADVATKISNAASRKAAQKKAVGALQVEVDTAETIVKVFSPAGVRAHILDEVTPFLNVQTARYLGTLSDGNITANWTTLVPTSKGEYREKFSIEVTNDKGGKKFGLMSGGEKRKVRIATALALQDLVATRATKPIELFIGDEIDDALDAAGLERLTQILEEKADERGSVFVISHNDLKDWISQSVIVEKKGGETVVTEVIA